MNAATPKTPSHVKALLLTCALSPSAVCAQNLTQADINNAIPGIVTQNGGNISITAGGGDTYNTEDSFTYLYEQRTGDFDVKVQVVNVDADDPAGVQQSAKASLHVRASLDKSSPDIQVNATPVTGAGYVETISRPLPAGETEDPPENTPEFKSYGGPWPGTYKPNGVLTYPVWLRVRREGNLFQTMASQDAVTWSVLAEYSMDAANFPPTLYVGLAAVAHVNAGQNTALRVRSSFTGYGDVVTPPVTDQGNFKPGAFPNSTVTGVNWNVSLPADGIGFSADKTQSGQIIWNGGGFDSLHRDILLDIGAQGPVPFSIARYAAGALDFGLSPSDPVAARANLGTGPGRDRSTPDASEAPAQAWFPSPRHGVLIPTLRKNGTIQWNDGAPAFYPHVYQALDFSSAKYFDMDSGTYGNGRAYTRMAKRGNAALPLASAGVYQRSAVDVSVAWFPYHQGWKAGSFEDSSNAGKAYWQDPVSHSAAATANTFVLTSNPRSTAEALLTWLDPSGTGTYSGLAELGFPAVNALTDGMLFLAPNNDGSSTMRGPQANCAIKADGSAWTVAVRDVEENKFDPATYAQAASSEFSFVYIPYTAGNLIGGKITGSTGAKAHSAGTFTLTRSETGRYEVTIPGKTANSGMLILQPVGTLPGNPAVVDRATLSYEPAPGGASFVIESRGISPGTGAGGLDEFPLQDSDFYFAWVDFTTPLTPAATAPEPLPVLSIVQGAGNTVTVSWPANVSGFTLESSPTLAAPWTPVAGVSNNSVTLTVAPGTPRLFLRLSKP
jgi:hypothetical protein